MASERASEQHETFPLDGMEVNQTHRKLLSGQKVLVPTAEKVESSQENGRLPPHSVGPTPRGVNHVPSPSTSTRSSKVRSIFPCKICLCPFTNATSARVHACTHFNPDELEESSLFHAKCPHCKKMFFQGQVFIHHVNAHEGRQNHVCPVCKKKFSTKQQLTAHLFVHLSGEERAAGRQGWRHGCYFCKDRFKSQSHLNCHVLTHTKEKAGWRCHPCRKTFFSKDSLTRHRFAAHLSEDEKVARVKQGTSRVCLFCQKKLPSNGTYHAHLVSHTKEKPFPCRQCGKLFGRNSNLNLHMRIHTSNPKPYKCDECDHPFSHKHHLTRHQKTVHRKLKDIACLQCGKKFGRRSDMVRHVRSVHAKIRHPCPHCDQTFSRKDYLGTHLKIVHPPK
ncbi:Zinc finger protein 2 [Folsomia candida]|uniref:Zinc finger protein 2 n=2 Tax=Folsomia candida TaxID=158441 RepID=A0A226DJW8_FOLCA|nr:Zinc finger protein 2 [Folsomia candida]